MAINKVIFAGTTLIDLTGDTVDPSILMNGYTAHNASGEVIQGRFPLDSDGNLVETVSIPKATSDDTSIKKEANKVIFAGETLIDITSDTITSDYLLSGYTAHLSTGEKVYGTFLQGYPDTFSVLSGSLTDEQGETIIDSIGNAVSTSGVVYKKTSETDTSVVYTKQ